MNSRYRSSSLVQKNPKVCKSDQLPQQMTPYGDPSQLCLDVSWYRDIGSGAQSTIFAIVDMQWDPADSSWLYGPDDNVPALQAEFEISPDGLTCNLALKMQLSGGITYEYISTWVPLQSRHPIESGAYRVQSPSGEEVVTWRVAG